MKAGVERGFGFPRATVSDCLRLPALRGSTVRAGAGGLGGHVRWASAGSSTAGCAPGEFRLVSHLLGEEAIAAAAAAPAAALAATIVSDAAAAAAPRHGLPVICLPLGTRLEPVATELLDFVVASLDSTVVRLRQVSARLGQAACADLRVEPLVETLAAVTGTPVLLTDAEHRLLWAVGSWPVGEGGGPGAQVLLTAAARADYARAAALGRPLHVDLDGGDGGGLSRLVVPMTAAGELLGWCTALLPADGLGRQVTTLAVEQAIHLVALAVLRRRSADLGGPPARTRLLVDLVTGGVAPDILVLRATALGVDLAQPHTVVVATPGVTPTGDSLAARVAGSLRVTPAPLADVVDGTVVALLPGEDRGRALHLARRLATALGPGSPVVVGDTAPTPRLPEATAEARRLLAAVERAAPVGRAERAVVDGAGLGLIGVLVRAAGDAGFDAFWRRRVEPLVDYDARQGTDLRGSVEAFLEAGSARAAAQRLGIHPNSLAYRLQRAESVGGFSLGRPEDRLEVDIALRCHRLLAS